MDLLAIAIVDKQAINSCLVLLSDAEVYIRSFGSRALWLQEGLVGSDDVDPCYHASPRHHHGKERFLRLLSASTPRFSPLLEFEELLSRQIKRNIII